MSEENLYARGFRSGQIKLADMILNTTLESVADYQWLLSHLKEVLDGREIVDNTAIGFRKDEN
jgi:hypothetical protein